MESTVYVKNSKLKDREFRKLSNYINENLGIKMPPEKKLMLESRLHRRLRFLQIPDFETYCNYLFSKEGMQNELVFMTDAVTTNKTDFFRESAHFDYMKTVVLPQLINSGNNKNINIWSAACSSGEEVYTLAMVLEEYKRETSFSWDYKILGTDISTDILQKANSAIYPMNRIDGVPMDLKKRYFLKSKNKDKPLVRVVEKLRLKSTFEKMNLMDKSYDQPRDFDMIFCRNVLIYFEKNIQIMVLSNLLKHLKKGGLIFIGHSESISHYGLPVEQVYNQVYKKI